MGQIATPSTRHARYRAAQGKSLRCSHRSQAATGDLDALARWFVSFSISSIDFAQRVLGTDSDAAIQAEKLDERGSGLKTMIRTAKSPSAGVGDPRRQAGEPWTCLLQLRRQLQQQTFLADRRNELHAQRQAGRRPVQRARCHVGSAFAQGCDDIGRIFR